MIRRLPLVGVRIHLSGSIPDKLTEKELVAFIGDYKTDANNIPKPMLALSSDKCAQSNFERECQHQVTFCKAHPQKIFHSHYIT